MTATFTSTDPKEIKRLAKATDMAIALFEITSAHRHKETVEDYKEAIYRIFEDNGINLDDLIE